MIWCKESTYTAEIPTLGDIFCVYRYLLWRISLNFSTGTLMVGTSWSSEPEGNPPGTWGKGAEARTKGPRVSSIRKKVK